MMSDECRTAIPCALVLYLLFITHRSSFFDRYSSQILQVGIDDDSKIVATLHVAAPEVIRHDGQLWLAALNPQLDGIRLTKLEFVDP